METRPDSDTRLPLLVDSRELARTAARLEGSFEIARLERLASLLASPAGRLAWRARGERRERADGHNDFLHLELAATPILACVRCLGEVAVPLQLARSFRLVASEAQAASEDADETELDVLAGGARFDLGELVEDEAIMALPAIARHEDCTLPGQAGQGIAEMPADEGDRIRPFAGLAALKKTGH